MPGKFHYLRLVRKKRMLKLRRANSRLNTIKLIQKNQSWAKDYEIESIREKDPSKRLIAQQNALRLNKSASNFTKALRDQRKNLWPKRKIKTRQ